MEKYYYALLLAAIIAAPLVGMYVFDQQPAAQTQIAPVADSAADIQQGTGSVEVTNISAPGVVKLGDTVTVEATVTNTGENVSSTQAQFILAGERYRRRTVRLSPGESTILHFEQSTMGIGVDPGDYYTGILVGDHGDMAPVTLRKGYDIDEISAPESVTAGEMFTITGEVKNYNHFDDEQVIQYRLDGDVLARKSVALQSDDERTVALQVDTSGIEPGTYVHGMTANGSGSHGTITVRASGDDA